MIQNTYNIDSSSSDEEEEDENTQNFSSKDETLPHVHDIQKLKDQTTELLDASWKETRNRHLLSKMLELEEPTITAKMVDFLLQDGVCETLISFVTQVGTGVKRPGPNDERTDALKYSYRAVVLLSADEHPSEPLMAFLGKKAMTIARKLFDIFHDDSAASFYHAYKIFECLLRFFPGDVYDGIYGDGKGAERIGSLFKYIGYAPVGDIIVMIIALTPISRMSQLYNTCAHSRWLFFEQLSQWTFLLKLAEAVVKPEEFCRLDEYVDAEAHSSAASQVLQELVEKLSLEETGEMLLQPLGYTTTILDHLLDTAISASCDEARRRASAKLLCFLLRRAAEPEVMCMFATATGGPPNPTVVPNRLYPLRERMICHIETRMDDVFAHLVNFDAVMLESRGGSDSNLAVKYPSYSVPQPFTAIRALIVECIVLMVESDEVVAGMIPVELWKLMLGWTTKYAHNNIYHSFFYRLTFAVLRQNQEPAQRVLFQKAKFTTFLIDSFLPFPETDEESSYRHKPEDLVQKSAARGLILNCVNAIRLQASCSPPNSFIRQFLNTHAKWKEFLPELMKATELQQRFGMGIRVGEGRANSYSSLMMMNAQENKQEEGGVEHGSRFAKSLGFYDDIAWPADSLAGPDEEEDKPSGDHYEEDASDTESLPPAHGEDGSGGDDPISRQSLSSTSMDEDDLPHSRPPEKPTFDPPEVDEHVTWTAPEVNLEHRLSHSLQSPDIHTIQSPEERIRRWSFDKSPSNSESPRASTITNVAKSIEEVSKIELQIEDIKIEDISEEASPSKEAGAASEVEAETAGDELKASVDVVSGSGSDVATTPSPEESNDISKEPASSDSNAALAEIEDPTTSGPDGASTEPTVNNEDD